MKNPLRILCMIVVGSIPVAGLADTYTELKDRVVEHELDNGMRFLIFERHEAPLVSMVITVRAGAVNEVTNKTGLAHFLEHLAFKGTETIGTTNYKRERKVLEELDAAFAAYHEARQKGADSATVAALYAEFSEKQEQASVYIVQGEFSEIYERNGGSGLNASTGYDYTGYYLTLPSNRFELWCAMESNRLANPVFREFYKERDVVIEERRMWIDNNPYGILYEELRSMAWKAHPYGHEILGHLSDVGNLSRADVRAFYETYYVPQHMSAAIVGDVDAEEVIELVDAYFGRIPARPDPPEVITQEPLQPGVRRFVMKKGKSPYMFMRFHTVPAGHPDIPILDLLFVALTLRLDRSLVEDKRIASGFSLVWNHKIYDGFVTLNGLPIEGVSAARLEKAILEELAALEENPITAEELDAAKARWKVTYYYRFSSNSTMAFYLAWYDACKGGWGELFKRIEKIDEITCQDLMDAAERYLDPDKRTVALMEVEDD